ncbi:MAG TPA: DNA polymerase III subunit delta', partial [Methyloceanibacter sp.]
MSVQAEGVAALADEPDRFGGFSAPREVERPIGHDAALAELEDAFRSGRLHHAWLIAGPEGIGKATLAYHFARCVLAARHAGGELPRVDPGDSVFRKVAGLAHPNLLVIRRAWNERTKRFGQWIGVDEVRRLRAFLGNTAGEAGFRVVIVDRADELNQNAANALLKVLEEPPPETVYFLISATEGKIPVTIRSRCRTLRVAPLAPDDLDKAVRGALRRDEHEVEEDALSVALVLSDGSVRRALELATGEGINQYREALALVGSLPELDGARVQKLAEKLAAQGEAERLELFYSLLLGLLERLIRFAATGQSATEEEASLGRKLLSHADLGAWAEAWAGIAQAKDETLGLNLDR